MLSPLLANIYLHYALDLWFEREVKPRLRGKAGMVRYADNFVLCFENGNSIRLGRLAYEAERCWRKWLCRRSSTAPHELGAL